ncbi:MAG TPA: hypothetical protein PK874_09345 [Desulfobacteraceae bacterium]|nr:hypothetical protein [Desulfobacteraceae bacterium]HPJ68957.1 hypothetical protein [Desulfobacteraceae bacterium]HPQ28482.1 hypothetical protein [Desulfobacteraceae bacterium]
MTGEDDRIRKFTRQSLWRVYQPLAGTKNNSFADAEQRFLINDT